jgi:very-short-patch-repair endonuclease
MADQQTNRARRLRRASTFAENLLWRMVRGRGLEDLKFRRQVPLGPYVVDFLCKSHRLVVELDGGVHDAPFYDLERQAARDTWLAEQGFKVLRFKNGDLEYTPHLVLNRILVEVAAAEAPPHPAALATTFSPRGEGDL